MKESRMTVNTSRPSAVAAGKWSCRRKMSSEAVATASWRYKKKQLVLKSWFNSVPTTLALKVFVNFVAW